jgi:hypothetical protein
VTIIHGVASGDRAASSPSNVEVRVSIDEQHVALPKLYGAPAYARPAPIVADSPRPFDPDDLPLESFQTDEEREYAAGRSASGDADGSTNGHGPHLRPRPFSLRAIAGKLLGGSSD